jgi:hypothetical protein
MPRNSIEDLRNHLFTVIEELQDPESKMEITKAKTIAQLAQTIINASVTEIEFMKLVQRNSPTNFFPDTTGQKPLPPSFD